MKKILTIPALLASILIFGGSVFAQQNQSIIKVEARVDKSEVNIGDAVRYEVSVKTKKNVEVEFPALEKNLEDFSIIDFGAEKKNYLINKKITHWYVIDTYTTGSYTIGASTIKYKPKNETEWLTAEIGEMKIEVASLLGEEEGQIKDIKGPVAPPSKVFFVLLGILLLGLLAAGFFLYRKFFLNKSEEMVVKKDPAYVIALRKLDILKAKNFPSQGKIEEYYVELSSIIRYYIEDRFNIRAPEMTTEEFLYNLKDSADLETRQKSVLREFLTATDKVKFARFSPLPEEIEDSFAVAHKFVEETKHEFS
jgi:hypothetical protein